MNDRIANALQKLFERHRIIFWYDAKQELRDDFEAVTLPGIEKVELANNEFSVKYRVLRREPAQKFLLYHEGPQPDDLENWLLDVQLTSGEFRTDQAAIWLSELELGLEFGEVVEAHAGFFQAVKRRAGLKKLLKQGDTKGQVRLKMLAACTGSDPLVESIVKSLLEELAEDRDEKMKLIIRCGLDDFLWEQLSRHYGYISNEPGVRDFVIELFKSCYAMGTDGKVKLTGDALVFLKRWKDSRRYEQSFEKLSNECADILDVEQDLGQRDFRDLLELDYFRLIEQKILRDLIQEVVARTVSEGEVTLWVRQRRQSYWYEEYRHLYKAAEYAAKFYHTLEEAVLDMESVADGVQRYCRFWFKVDQNYRKYIYHMRSSGQTSLLQSLTEKIENLYTNNFLLQLGDNFQTHVDGMERWGASPVPLQSTFFDRWVKPFLKKENKVCVIISDALRYEIGDELLRLIRQEDRYSAELEVSLTMLPSYTQLGMASLLPHEDLQVKEDSTVLVDGHNSQGLENRRKSLGRQLNGRAAALRADDLMAMNKEECRTLIKDHDALYVFHNRIDQIGDKRDSEERTFEAVEETLVELIRVIKKLTGANANNLLLTADHGFIYQHRALEESDYSSVDAKGEEVFYRDRRFVLGKGFEKCSSLHAFTSSQLGLTGDVEVQIPKSINRLRLKGSGSRFVHGGATLQEVITPILKINKKRQSDVAYVGVEILRGASTVITSGQLAVTLYQTCPVSDKIHPRKLYAGIYTEQGELISDSHELTFDLTAENSREREMQIRFVLTRKADEANGQEVILKLREKHAGTSHYQDYKTLRYVMRRSFTSDFDF